MLEALICDGIRTPFGRYGGALSSVRPDDLAALPIRELLRRNAGLDPAAIDDVLLGCANQAGEDNRNVARMALLLAGLPEMVPGSTVNRLCGSGMDAVAMAARSIRVGEASVVLAGGVESMSRAPFVCGKPDKAFARNLKLEDTTMGWRFINPRLHATYGTDTMPETAENVAKEFGISREDQDAFALRSQQRTQKAREAGFFENELMKVSTNVGRGEEKIVSTDEQPRPDTTLEGLAGLKPVVRSDGTVTAGNASGINDGAAALLLASREAATHYGLPVMGKVLAVATAGVPPRLMGMGPVPAIRKVLALAGLRKEDIDVLELNEAFSAQALAVMRQLNLDDKAEHVNPNGGAIALGHPLGASGARLVLTALRQLKLIGKRYALCAMCIGVGQGIAAVLESV